MPDRVLVGLIARAHRRFEPELAAIDALLPARRRVALDVGTWYGPWTLALASRFEQVIGVEPNAAVAARLRGALPANCRLEQWAASDNAGTALLHAPEALGAEGVGSLRAPPGEEGSGSTSEVATRTIDSLELTDVDFVKLDVEGHELEALAGARATIERCRPVLLVELEERLAPVAPVMELLVGLGYRPHVVRDGQVEGIDPASFEGRTPAPRSYLAAVVRPDRDAPPNNVLFVP
jgi:FkbM family methyltransferase